MMDGSNDMPRNFEFRNFDDIPTSHLAMPTPNLIDNTEFKTESTEQQAPETSKAPTMWSTEFYKNLFDVDTEDVIERIKWSFIPYGNFLQNCIRHKPDLYGPVWICITLIFVTAIAGNIADYFHSQLNTEYHWKYDFHTVTTAATVIFFYAWMLPCLLWAIQHWYGSEHEKLKLIEIISLYGYCLSIFIPLSALWLIPKLWFQWVVTIFGSTASGLVLTKAMYPIFTKKMYPILICLLLLHIYVASMFMLHFFPVSPSTTATTTTTTTTTTAATSTSNIVLKNVIT